MDLVLERDNRDVELLAEVDQPPDFLRCVRAHRPGVEAVIVGEDPHRVAVQPGEPGRMYIRWSHLDAA